MRRRGASSARVVLAFAAWGFFWGLLEGAFGGAAFGAVLGAVLTHGLRASLAGFVGGAIFGAIVGTVGAPLGVAVGVILGACTVRARRRGDDAATAAARMPRITSFAVLGVSAAAAVVWHRALPDVTTGSGCFGWLCLLAIVAVAVLLGRLSAQAVGRWYVAREIEKGTADSEPLTDRV